MNRRLSAIALISLILLLLLSSGVVAHGGNKQVGLVIQFPDGQVHTEVVTVPAEATVADVLQQASLPVTLTTTDFGIALCAIGDTGCPADNCFCDQNNFWAFYIQQDGQWTAASVGVGQYTPQDKEVVGFAWSGFDENYNPTVQPPFYTFEQLAGTSGLPVVPLIAGAFVVGILAAAGILLYRRGRAQSAA